MGDQQHVHESFTTLQRVWHFRVGENRNSQKINSPFPFSPFLLNILSNILSISRALHGRTDTFHPSLESSRSSRLLCVMYGSLRFALLCLILQSFFSEFHNLTNRLSMK